MCGGRVGGWLWFFLTILLVVNYGDRVSLFVGLWVYLKVVFDVARWQRAGGLMNVIVGGVVYEFVDNLTYRELYGVVPCFSDGIRFRLMLDECRLVQHAAKRDYLIRDGVEKGWFRLNRAEELMKAVLERQPALLVEVETGVHGPWELMLLEAGILKSIHPVGEKSKNFKNSRGYSPEGVPIPGVYVHEIDLKPEIEVAKRSWDEAFGVPAGMIKLNSNFAEAELRSQQFAEQYLSPTGRSSPYKGWVYRDWVRRNFIKENMEMKLKRLNYEAKKSFTVGDVLDKGPCETAKVKFQSWCFEKEHTLESCLVAPDGKEITYFLGWVYENQPNQDWMKWLVGNEFIQQVDDGDFVVEMGDFVKHVGDDFYYKNSIYLVHQSESSLCLVRVYSGNGSTPVGSKLAPSYLLESGEEVTMGKLLEGTGLRIRDFKKLGVVTVSEL